MLEYEKNGGTKMTNEELIEKLELIQKFKCETPTLEIKSAEQGCPKHLYDSLSSFPIMDDGGIIILVWMKSKILKKWEYMIRKISRRK